MEDAAALVGGAARIRRSAQSLAALGQLAQGDTRLERCGQNLDRELPALQSWSVSLGYALVNARPVSPPHYRDAEGRSALIACVRDAARSRDKATTHTALLLLWTSQHLDNLWRLEARLGERMNSARVGVPDARLLQLLRLLRTSSQRGARVAPLRGGATRDERRIGRL